jgi:hypothetical protein
MALHAAHPMVCRRGDNLSEMSQKPLKNPSKRLSRTGFGCLCRCFGTASAGVRAAAGDGGSRRFGADAGGGGPGREKRAVRARDRREGLTSSAVRMCFCSGAPGSQERIPARMHGRLARMLEPGARVARVRAPSPRRNPRATRACRRSPAPPASALDAPSGSSGPSGAQGSPRSPERQESLEYGSYSRLYPVLRQHPASGVCPAARTRWRGPRPSGRTPPRSTARRSASADGPRHPLQQRCGSGSQESRSRTGYCSDPPCRRTSPVSLGTRAGAHPATRSRLVRARSVACSSSWPPDRREGDVAASGTRTNPSRPGCLSARRRVPCLLGATASTRRPGGHRPRLRSGAAVRPHRSERPSRRAPRVRPWGRA